MSYQLTIFKDNVLSPYLTATDSTIKEPTVRDLISINKLDTWEAAKIPNHNEYSTQVKNSYHIRKEMNGQTEGYHIFKPYVAEKYQVMQYTDALQWLDPFLMEKLLIVDSTLLLEHGAKFSVFCDIGLEDSVLPEDTVQRHLLLALSHDGSQRGFYFCDTRPICANTLQIAKLEGLRNPGKSLVMDDTNPERTLELARKLINLNEASFLTKDMQMYKAYANLELETSQVDYIMRSVLNMPLGKLTFEKVKQSTYNKYKAIQEAYTESPGMDLIDGDTGWRVLNAVTNYSQYLNEDSEKAFVKNQFGVGQDWRKKTMNLLDDLLPDTAIPVG